MLRCCLVVLGLVTLVTITAHADDRLVVHEWGTFTSLEDEEGVPIGGVNTDDEPLPQFVHDLNGMIRGPTEVPAIFFQGVPRCDPDVLARLETPVIYFHLPATGPKSVKLDLDVTFHGGWLTQYFPDAEVRAPGLHPLDGGRYGTLSDKTDGTLGWHGLTIGRARAGPVTKAPVWLAPRAVAAADVTTAHNESERFLFYRGVGHINPPIQIVRSTDQTGLVIQAQSPDMLRRLWLVEVRSDGRCALRSLSLAPAKEGNHLLTAATFPATDYSADTIGAIRKSLKAAMISKGLFSDEADALLNTWETSYFRRPGLRLFFLCPDDWTNRVLPLHLSVDADIKRVMIGRIEIVRPEQRELLSRIAQGQASNAGQWNWVSDALKQAGGGRDDFYREEWYLRAMDGRTSLQSLHVQMPDDYRAYLQLGRFRNTLILDEAHRRPTTALTAFIDNYSLEATGG